MIAGQTGQIGSPQDVWDHPSGPFVYGFLDDVILCHGRACLSAKTTTACAWPPRSTARYSEVQDCKAFAYVRPQDLDVQRHITGATDQPPGIVAKLARAMMVGPIARLKLLPLDASVSGSGDVMAAQIPAQHDREPGLGEGETVWCRHRAGLGCLWRNRFLDLA